MKQLLLLVAIIAPAVICESAPRKSLHVGDVAGVYTKSNANTPYTKLTLRLVRTYKHYGFEQADFSGMVDDRPLVGQAIITGDNAGMNEYVQVDLLLINPQDETSVLHGQSLMKNGRVVGLQLKEDDSAIVFRRVKSK